MWALLFHNRSSQCRNVRSAKCILPPPFPVQKRYQDKLKDSMRLEAQSVGAQHSKEDFELQVR